MREIVKFDTPELSAIEPSKAEQIRSVFEPMAEMIEKFEIDYDNILTVAKDGITKDIIVSAKRLRLDIGKVRTATGELKDKQKEKIRLEDKAIMGVHNILVWAIKEKEDKLSGIEKYFEIQEKKRLDDLQDFRAKELLLYVENAHEMDLSSMDDDVWSVYFSGKQKEYEDRVMAERKAERHRVFKEKSDAEESERIRKENEQLKKESEERDRKQEEEKSKHLAELKKQQDEKDKIAGQLKVKLDAEKKDLEEKELLKKEELNKGDSDKIKDLVSDLNLLKSKYSFKSDKNIAMYSSMGLFIDKVIVYIKS